ncbi:MAG: hypothetical protein ACRYFW_00510 [Janthinobacterium lividum]
MGTFRFHLIGGHPVNVDVDARSIVELGEMITRERFIIGTRTEPDEDGVLPGILIASSRIQCAVEAG